jgi:curved DNA-binding protein CbpA
MSRQEAYDILGLRPGAGEAEVREAHHRLMRGAHPDVGGSAWLATRINQARDVLLG